MSPRARFWIRAVAASTALFAVWAALALAGIEHFLLAGATSVIPAVGVIAASAGNQKRRIAAIAGLLLIYGLSATIADLLGVATASGRAALGDSVGPALWALHHAFRVGLPVAAVVVYARGQLSSLWQPDLERV